MNTITTIHHAHSHANIDRVSRFVVGLIVVACMAGVPLILTGCDNTESHSKQTTTKTVETPTEKTKTTTTTEKKVETQPK